MILLNFTHPLSVAHVTAIEKLAKRPLDRVIEVPTQLEQARPFEGQVRALLEFVGFSAQDWQTLALLVNLPSHNVIAALLIAELHGRMGYFPAVLRLRPVGGNTPTQFEVAEVINLQAVREAARELR